LDCEPVATIALEFLQFFGGNFLEKDELSCKWYNKDYFEALLRKKFGRVRSYMVINSITDTWNRSLV
jgi:hypothetical protein